MNISGVQGDANTGGARGRLPSPGDAAQQLDPLLLPPSRVYKAPVPLPAQAGWAGPASCQRRGWSWGSGCLVPSLAL